MDKIIPLTQGKFAIIDDEDYEIVSQHKWYAARRGERWYAQRNVRVDGKRKTEYLHRFILPSPDSLFIDHSDGDGLNCRRNNIRVATPAQNQINRIPRSDNSSMRTGVSFYKDRKKFGAYINYKGKRTHLGFYDDVEEANNSRDRAEVELYGDFSTALRPEKE